MTVRLQKGVQNALHEQIHKPYRRQMKRQRQQMVTHRIEFAERVVHRQRECERRPGRIRLEQTRDISQTMDRLVADNRSMVVVSQRSSTARASSPRESVSISASRNRPR